MAFTFGFYNSQHGDRRYDAVQMSKIFSGVINDGVFMSIGTSLMVEADIGTVVNVGVGKAWFHDTWSDNDAKMPIEIPQADLILDRIDAIVLEINASEESRTNTIKVIKGTPATIPLKPTLIKSTNINQYPLCYITVTKNVREITQSNIENMVGTSECPFITGILKTMDIDALIAQWQSQWNDWVNQTQKENAEWTAAEREKFLEWIKQQEEDFAQYTDDFKFEFESFMNSNQSEFTNWFNNIKGQLSDDAAGRLQNQINSINELEFNRYYGLIAKNTLIEKGLDGRVKDIIERSEEATATTTFQESGNIKIITTTLVPGIGSWSFVKTTTIISELMTKTIKEEFTRIPKI